MIKVENPKDGDLARKLGILPELNKRLMGTSFIAQNCNKKSITLNTKSAEGKAIFLRLAKDADVVVENFRPGVMDRLGLGYKVLSEANPGLVYCAISGFGQTGPDALNPAYDQIIQGLSGEMAVNGDERLNPLRAGFPVCDTVGGLNAAFAVMAALFHRQRTGEGQSIDVALLDSIMPLMGWVAANLLIGHQQPVLMGNDNFTAAPSGTFRTLDGHINIAANKQEQWEAVCDVLQVPELKIDPRFEERDTRKKNRRRAHAAAGGEAGRAHHGGMGGRAQRRRCAERRHPESRGGLAPAAARPPRRAEEAAAPRLRRHRGLRAHGAVREDAGHGGDAAAGPGRAQQRDLHGARHFRRRADPTQDRRRHLTGATMGMTVVEKILARAAGLPSVAAGESSSRRWISRCRTRMPPW